MSTVVDISLPRVNARRPGDVASTSSCHVMSQYMTLAPIILPTHNLPELLTDSRALLRGLVKLKKIQKFEKNSDWSNTTHPPPISFIIIFFEKHLKA